MPDKNKEIYYTSIQFNAQLFEMTSVTYNNLLEIFKFGYGVGFDIVYEIAEKELKTSVFTELDARLDDFTDSWDIDPEYEYTVPFDKHLNSLTDLQLEHFGIKKTNITKNKFPNRSITKIYTK